MPTLFTGFRRPLYPGSAGDSFINEMDPDGNQVQGDKPKVEDQVCVPAHVAQDAAAGTGHPVPEVQQRQGDVPGEEQQQLQGEYQPCQLCAGKKQQPRCQEFRRGEGEQQDIGKAVREGLVIQLPAEIVKADQLAGCGINEQQDQQGSGKGSYQCFHRSGIDETKERGAGMAKQYEMGSIPLIA